MMGHAQQLMDEKHREHTGREIEIAGENSGTGETFSQPSKERGWVLGPFTQAAYCLRPVGTSIAVSIQPLVI